MGTLSEDFTPYAESVATHLLGKHTHRYKNELRWGRKGSLVVHLTGPRRGRFHDYEAGTGGDLIDLVQRERGGSVTDALTWLREFTHVMPAPALPQPTSERGQEQLRWSRKAQSLWDRSIPLPGTLGEKYLRMRRCYVPHVGDLRFLPGNEEHLPAVIARVTDFRTGNPLSLSFIRLDPRTGEKVSKGNLASHVTAGGVVRLIPCIPVGGVLGLAEGIETALSVVAVKGYPVWATLGLDNLRKYPPVAAYREVHIWADNHKKGLEAAHEFADRWTAAGHVVRIIVPPQPDTDWNDVVRGDVEGGRE